MTVSIMTFSFIPYTLFFIKPVNDALFAIEDKDKSSQDNRIRTLVKKWNKLQYVRTIFGIGVFVGTLVAIHHN